jgi:trans-2,3-dihydro-3-hydroxyanthranilate isomerase
MPQLHYHLVDVFTHQAFGGNQLAVFVDGRGLDTALMQNIAKEMNLSESTFILPADDAANNYRLRIFTPGREMPMAGHPTVGTTYVLGREKMIDVSGSTGKAILEEGVGPITVTYEVENGIPTIIKMQQPMPTFGPVFEDRALIVRILSIEPTDLADLPVEVVSCGVPFLYIPITNLEAIGRTHLRLDLWEQHLKHYAASSPFVFTMETVHATSTVHSRMFAPEMGITEDPATGAASGPLGCYLVRHGLVQGNPAVIVSEQGLEMGRPSFLHIEIAREGDTFTHVSVGGQCVYMGQGTLWV